MSTLFPARPRGVGGLAAPPPGVPRRTGEVVGVQTLTPVLRRVIFGGPDDGAQLQNEGMLGGQGHNHYNPPAGNKFDAVGSETCRASLSTAASVRVSRNALNARSVAEWCRALG